MDYMVPFRSFSRRVERIIQSCYSFCVLRGWHNILHMLFSLVFEWLIPCAFSPIILIPSFQNTLRLYVCVLVCTGMCRHAGVSEDSFQDLILPLWRQGLSCFCYAVYSSLAGSWASRLFYCLNLPSPYRTAGITDVHHWIWLFFNVRSGNLIQIVELV